MAVKPAADYVAASQISLLLIIAASHLKWRRVNCKQFEMLPLTLKRQSDKKSAWGTKLLLINAIPVSKLF
jgi:hypothetical protein